VELRRLGAFGLETVTPMRGFGSWATLFQGPLALRPRLTTGLPFRSTPIQLVKQPNLQGKIYL